MCVYETEPDRQRERETVSERERERGKEGRETSPTDSCFSSFCFMLGPSSSLVERLVQLSSGFLAHLKSLGKAVSLACASHLFISHLLAVIQVAFEPADVNHSQKQQSGAALMKSLRQIKY